MPINLRFLHQATAQPFGWVFAWRKGMIRKTADRWFMQAAPHTLRPISLLFTSAPRSGPQFLSRRSPAKGATQGCAVRSNLRQNYLLPEFLHTLRNVFVTRKQKHLPVKSRRGCQKRCKIDTEVDIIRQCTNKQRLLQGAPLCFPHFSPKAVDFQKGKILQQRIFRRTPIFMRLYVFC